MYSSVIFAEIFVSILNINQEDIEENVDTV